MKWEKYHMVWTIMIFGWVTNYMVRSSLSPLLIHFLGSLIAPWATGWVKDLTASFSWGLYLAAIFCIFGGTLIFTVRPSFRFGKERPIS